MAYSQTLKGDEEKGNGRTRKNEKPRLVAKRGVKFIGSNIR